MRGTQDKVVVVVFVSVAIVFAWSVLLGGAYLYRATLGLSRRSSVCVMAGLYGLLCIPTLAWFGLTQTGLLAAAGLILPCAAGMVGAVIKR